MGIEEIWDAYDKTGNKLNTTLVRGQTIPEGVYHLVVQCMIQHTDGDYLLMQRAKDKDLYPGFFEFSAGGSATTGETSLVGVKREVYEETGLSDTMPHFIERSFRGHDIFDLYLETTNADKSSIIYQQGETIDHKWVDLPGLIDFFEGEACIATQKLNNSYLKRLRPLAPMYPLFKAIKESMGDNCVGIYVHGSTCLGDLVKASSDIDFLVVCHTALTVEEKHQIIDACLTYEHLAPAKGIEMSVVTLQSCQYFQHPCAYQLHYSATHRKLALADSRAYLQRFQGVDGDLATHFALTKQSGLIVFGPAVNKVFKDISKSAILESIRSDIIDSQSSLNTAHVNLDYTIANLARTVYYLQHQTFISKRAGLCWAIKQPDAALRACANYVLQADGERDAGEQVIHKTRLLAKRVLNQLKDKLNQIDLGTH